MTFCLKPALRTHKFSEKDSIKIARLYKEGKNAQEIGEIFNLSPKIISGKKGHLFRLGLLKRTQKPIISGKNPP